ncbi:hypothetical protein KC331_g15832, partial [Hortaea werneckii]
LSDFARKIRKRFGRIFKSDEESISSMLLAHKDQVADTMLEETRDWQEEDTEDTNAMVDGQDGQAQTDLERAQPGMPPCRNGKFRHRQRDEDWTPDIQFCAEAATKSIKMIEK